MIHFSFISHCYCVIDKCLKLQAWHLPGGLHMSGKPDANTFEHIFLLHTFCNTVLSHVSLQFPGSCFLSNPSACSRNGTSQSALLHWGRQPSLARTDSIDPRSILLTPVSLVWPCPAMPFRLKLPRSRRYNVLSKNCFVIRIQLLDNHMIECTLSVEGTGQECLEAVAQRLELREVKKKRKTRTAQL